MSTVELVWEDATYDEDAPPARCTRRMVGWLVEEAQESVVIALDVTTWENGEVTHGHLYRVPRCLVRSLRQVPDA